MQKLGKLPSAALATHAAAVVSSFQDADEVVRRRALLTMGKLEPALLAAHASALMLKLKDTDKDARRAAASMLGKLSPTQLVEQLTEAADVLRALSTRDDAARLAAAQTAIERDEWVLVHMLLDALHSPER